MPFLMTAAMLLMVIGLPVLVIFLVIRATRRSRVNAAQILDSSAD